MSIRHYNPRRRRRGGISPKARNFLGALVALIILLQISYPLIEGEALRIVTIATVFVAAIAMVVHGHLSYGFKYSSRYLPITYAFGLGIEVLGVHTGWPFGVYEYDASLGVQLFGGPLIVPCAWVMMVHPCLCAARRIAGNWVFLYGGALLAAWDLFLDPQMVGEGHWTWASPDPGLPGIPGIPLTNYVGWIITALIIMALLSRLPTRKPTGDGVPTLMLAWVYFSNVLANAVFFGRPWVAVWGGIIMGAVVIPWAWISWTRRP